MKTIGIITYHRAYNYGSVLQAYALNSYLRKIGFNAHTIDYRTNRQDQIYADYERIGSIMSILRNIYSFYCRKATKRRKIKFDEFVEGGIKLTKKIYYEGMDLSELEDDYDYFICGSDQVWNPICIDFDENYLLEFVTNKNKCIAYAPSIALDSLPVKWIPIFKKNLSDFKKLSVREKSGAQIIHDITGRDVETVADPVFLVSKETWEKIARSPIKGKYIFCYFIGDIEGMREYAKSIGKKYGMPLVVVYKSIRDVLYRNKKCYEAGPEEFLGLIQNAEYICTNSFHAVAFSLIFRKNFGVFVDEKSATSAKSRIEDLLDLFGLSDCILSKSNSNARMESLILKITYDDVFDQKFKMFTDYAKQFIERSICE